MSEFSLIDTIEVANVLGECILWDEATQCTWWTDIHSARLYRYQFGSGNLDVFSLPERLCSFGLIDNDPRLVCAFASGFALYDPVMEKREWLYRPEQHFSGTRFNDGRVDRQGRFWSGTMVEAETATDAQGLPVKGGLYWVSGAAHGKVLDGIAIANSLCWSPDSRTAYFADSPSRQICAYDFDAVTAAFGGERVFARTQGDIVPDGAIIDAEAHLWNAQFRGGKIVRYTPVGDIQSQVELPVSQPTCICLGGPDMNLLFVTSARENLSERELARQPAAGHVFVFETPYRGLPESRYRL